MAKLTTSYADDFLGFPVNASIYWKKAVYREILAPIHHQLQALLSYHSRITVVRFDLHFPDHVGNDPKHENKQVERLLKQIKDNLRLARWGSHKRFVTGAVREVGITGKGHYHIFIAFESKYRRLGAFNGSGNSGVWGLIQSRWYRLTGGSVHFSTSHTIERDDDDAFAKCFHHLSYLAKTKDKAFGTGESHKRYFFSRLKPKALPAITETLAA